MELCNVCLKPENAREGEDTKKVVINGVTSEKKSGNSWMVAGNATK